MKPFGACLLDSAEVGRAGLERSPLTFVCDDSPSDDNNRQLYHTASSAGHGLIAELNSITEIRSQFI